MSYTFKEKTDNFIHIHNKRKEDYYRYRLDANTISFLINFIASLNFFSMSELPIVLEACTISLSNSSNLRIALIIEPSNISVNLHSSPKSQPLHQANTTSII